MKKWAFKLLLGAFVGISALLSAVELRRDHPDVYVVKKSDTLWDISATFLDKPWLWPEIWQVNPQVANPHLIYPGDVLSLVYIDGQPRITRKSGVIKLSPGIREISRGEAISALPLEMIKPFLVGARVVSQEQLDAAPYMLTSDGDHLVAGKNVRIYARGIKQAEVQASYALFRKGDEYRDPVTQELLGLEAIHLGAATVAREGDPVTLDITESVQEARKGDHLLPIDEQHLKPYFYPHAAKEETNGQIISVYEGVTQIGQYHVVIINRGTREGIEVGHVFSVWKKGEMFEDKVAKKRRRSAEDYSTLSELADTISGDAVDDAVQLPDEEAGEIMVFRTFEKVSLALVMEASRPIHLLDKIRNPY